MSRYTSIAVRSIIHLTLAAAPTLTQGQRLGDTQSGSESPTEAKAVSLTPTALSGDVDLFSGTYNASHSLGSVSTPAGLSFELTLNYSPTIIGGATPLVHEGIPYGSGWSLNLPTISVNTAYWNRLSPLDRTNFNPGGTTNPARTFDHVPGQPDQGIDPRTDGYGVWYEPHLNIPGVASGRLVYQKHVPDGVVFVLNTFTEPIEALYSGGGWEVTVPDGRIYQFGDAATASQMPSNARSQHYDKLASMIENGYNDPHASYNRQVIRNAIMPKAHVLTWYCARISNSLHGPNQYIQFIYDHYGQWNMLKEYQQPFQHEIALAFFNDSEDVTPFTNIAMMDMVCTYQDVILRSVSSGSLLTTHERIVLEHEHAVPGPNMVAPGGGNDYPVYMHQCLDAAIDGTGAPQNSVEDPLYLGKVMKRWGVVDGQTGSDFDNWQHYPHFARSAPTSPVSSWTVNQTDPYRDPYTGLYTTWPISGNAASGILFDEGFLSSNAILPNQVIPGDLWEVRTAISAVDTRMNFDIKVRLDRPTQSIYSESPSDRLFSTFDRMLKWNTYGTNGQIITSNVFSMPYVGNGPAPLPTGNLGIRIQVGPANSDNNFNMGGNYLDRSDLQVPAFSNAPSAYRSYPHRLYQLREGTGNTGSLQNGLPSHHPVPQNFGIGLPWSSMIPVHREFEQDPSESENGLQTPDEDSHFRFWWSNGSIDMPWPNKPTTLSITSKLNGVELIRYGKRPWMLRYAKKFVRNGETNNDGGWQLEAQTAIEYQRTDMQVPIPGQSGIQNGAILYEPYKRSVYELVGIERQPVEVIGVNYPSYAPVFSTRFQYTNAQDFAPPQATTICHDPAHPEDPEYDSEIFIPDPLRAIVVTGRLLHKVYHPMGQEMTLEYNDPLDPELSHFQHLNAMEQGFTLGYDPSVDLCQSFYIQNATGTISPTVKEVARTDFGSNAIRRTNYSYEQKRQRIKGLRLPTNYRTNKPLGRDEGYLIVIVNEPQNEEGLRVKREYRFHGDIQQSHVINSPSSCNTCPVTIQTPPWPPPVEDHDEYLLWGKLKEVVIKSPQGNILERTETTYEPHLAYLNAIFRPAKGSILQTTHAFDYLDLMPGFDIEQGLSRFKTDLGELGTWSVAPRFLEDKLDLPGPTFIRPDIHMNSYFIERKKEVHTTYDNEACVIPEVFLNQEPSSSPTKSHNADGTNLTNTNVNGNALDLTTAMEAHGLTPTVKNALIAAGPLQESLVQKAILVTDSGSGALLREVLYLQARLTNQRQMDLLAKIGPFLPNDAATILKKQPVLADTVLKMVITSPGLNNQEKAEILLSRAHLSTEIQAYLLHPSQPFSSSQLVELYLKQPPLTFHIQELIARDEHLHPSARARILAQQPLLGTGTYSIIADDRSAWPAEALEELILTGKGYPEDAFLEELINDASIPPEVLRNILAASPGPYSNGLRTLIEGAFPVAPQYRDELLSRTATGLAAYCGSPCTRTNVGISTVTEFSYYTADETGVTTAPGYRALLGLENEVLEPTIQLKWEPSWLLFSTRTSSPQYPDAYSEKRNFYYQDLRNRYDRHWSALLHEDHCYVEFDPVQMEPPVGNFNISVPMVAGPYLNAYGTHIPVMEPVKLLTEFGDRTAQPFEVQSWSKAPGSQTPSISSTYYEFTGNWDWTDLPTYLTVDHGTPCTPTINDGEILGDIGTQVTTKIFVHPRLKSSHWNEHLDLLPDGYRYVSTPAGALGIMRNADWNDQPGLTTLFASTLPELTGGGPKMRPFRYMMSHAFLHKATHQQADETLTDEYLSTRHYNEIVPLMDFREIPPFGSQNNGSLWRTILPYRVITNEEKLAYNWDSQPIRSMNERELVTEVEYTMPIHHLYHSGSPCTTESVVEYQHPAKPSRITVGVGTDAPQVTTYSYTPLCQVATVTDANGTSMSMEYDGNGQVVVRSRNGVLIESSSYNVTNYHIPLYSDGLDQTKLNWTETRKRIFPESTTGVGARTYMDPNGRSFATFTAPMDITIPGIPFGPTTLSGRQHFDAWSRPIRSYNPVDATGSGFIIDQSMVTMTGVPYQSTIYEQDHRSRPLRHAAQEEDPMTGHTKKTRYHFLNSIAFACELGLSAQEIGLLMPGSHSAYRWISTEVEDEDGNLTRSYTNAIGQQVATVGDPNGGARAVTLFLYDDRGQLSMVINPRKHQTRYQYNILGWPIRRTTTNDGQTKYMYDISGNVVLQQDANGAMGEEDPNILVNGNPCPRAYYRRTIYDQFNRPVRQERVRQTHPADQGYTGTHIKSWPVDVLAYTTRNQSVEWPTELLDEEPWNVSAYTFTSASTIDRFARFSVMARRDFTNGGGYTIEPITVGVDELLATPIPEKEWVYDKAELAPTDPVEANTLYQGTTIDLAIWRQGLTGRLSHTITYPHRLFSSVETAQNPISGARLWPSRPISPVHYEFHSYNGDGFISWQLQQFNANGITPLSKGQQIRLDYPSYTMDGQLRTVNVDVNNDGVLDMQQAYDYDGLGRLSGVYLNLADVGTAGELIASYTYDIATGLPKRTRYQRKKCGEHNHVVIEQIEHEFDSRMRLRSLESDHYTEHLYYDGQLPQHSVAGPVDGGLHYNGSINGLAHQYGLQGMSGHEAGYLDLPTLYGFRYDGLGRMVKADAIVGDRVEGLPADHPWFTLGDERYTFDRAGNIGSTRRHGLYNGATTPNIVDWSYTYQAGTDRLRRVDAYMNSALPSRQYAYDPAGNLRRDEARNMASTRYGRANLPFTVELFDGTYTTWLDHLYGPADQRLYKQHVSDKNGVETQEFHLYDAQGRVLGVADLNGGEPDVDGNQRGAWTWYAFGQQRFARYTPQHDQQPELYTSDLGNYSEVNPEGARYTGLLEYLMEANLAPGGINYPCEVVQLKQPNGAFLTWSSAYYDEQRSLDPAWAELDLYSYTFTTDKATVEMSRNAGEQPILVSVEELLGEGQAKSGANGVPFTYATYADTRLRDVTFYLHDHLGNTRVTYKVGCDGNNGTGHLRTLEHAVDYYPYGSILREFVNGQQEKYLTTHHERDQETGLDYRGARYYDSDVARFLSLDPLAADYASWSPYNYVMGNPVSLVDPDGRQVDDYRLNENGKIEYVRQTKDDFDRLFYSGHDGKGGIESGSVKVHDPSLLPSLSGNGHAETSRGEEAFRLFLTLARGSDVEWRLTGFQHRGAERFELHTDRNPGSVKPALFTEKQTFSMHSHDGFGMEGAGASGRYPLPAKAGDSSDQAAYANKKETLRGKEPSPHYVYHPYSNRMSQYNEKVRDFNVDYNANRCLGHYCR